ncbi:MAG: MbcA/ParS/Xre antitoxin family protein [Xanthomonadaceae bacterium]|nr:MbcA/ParS/Xre antitoxin family protein [Xanthomonadaceae bacterium]
MSNTIDQKLAQDPAKTAGAALRAFFNIVQAWDLDTEQAMTLLGFDRRTRSTFFKWKRDPESARLTREKLERLSYLFGIYKGLQILLPKPESADAWIHRPNDAPLFAGRPALERMLSGNVADLYVVRQYLDAQRGWS